MAVLRNQLEQKDAALALLQRNHEAQFMGVPCSLSQVRVVPLKGLENKKQQRGVCKHGAQQGSVCKQEFLHKYRIECQGMHVIWGTDMYMIWGILCKLPGPASPIH
eukprot:1161685-Pelagomonas_calceolata.AAC.14